MRKIATTLALVAAMVLAGTPVHAGKPDHAGKGNGNSGKGASGSHGQGGGGSSHGGGGGGSSHGGGGGGGGGDHGGGFSTSQRSSYLTWYDHEYHGSCPPGLAKKHNGCMPPGLAKKRYTIGYPLPPGVVLGPVPSALVVVLGPPPVGYRYGVLDGDVVQLAIGTAMVVDAIDGLANR